MIIESHDKYFTDFNWSVSTLYEYEFEKQLRQHKLRTGRHNISDLQICIHINPEIVKLLVIY